MTSTIQSRQTERTRKPLHFFFSLSLFLVLFVSHFSLSSFYEFKSIELRAQLNRIFSPFSLKINTARLRLVSRSPLYILVVTHFSGMTSRFLFYKFLFFIFSIKVEIVSVISKSGHGRHSYRLPCIIRKK